MQTGLPGGLRPGFSFLGAGWSSPVARQAHNLKVVGSNPTPATKITIYQYVTTFQVFWLARFFALGILPFVTHFVTCRQVFLGFYQAHFLKALSANPAPATSKYYFTSAYKPHQI